MNQTSTLFSYPCCIDYPDGDLDDFIFAVSEDALISDR